MDRKEMTEQSGMPIINKINSCFYLGNVLNKAFYMKYTIY